MSNLQLGELIGQGRTADIHAWEDDKTVIKLYQDWFQLEWIHIEKARFQAVQGFGLPIPTVGEVTRESNRNGLILERINGMNMLDMLLQKPTLASSLAARLAKLQAELHAVNGQPDIPLLHQKLEEKIRAAKPLPDDLKTALIEKLHTMPHGNSICHGDFHPGNIVVTKDEAVIVDWLDCAYGNPIADVARSTILFLGGITGDDNLDPKTEELIHNFHQQYLNHYFAITKQDRAEYEQWLPIIAGARLDENIPALESWLLSEAEKINT